jgi:hypothetical protein
MRIDNVNIWLLMIREETILGEKPESVSVSFNSNSEAEVTASFKDGFATYKAPVSDLEHFVNEEVKPGDNLWTRS